MHSTFEAAGRLKAPSLSLQYIFLEKFGHLDSLIRVFLHEFKRFRDETISLLGEFEGVIDLAQFSPGSVIIRFTSFVLRG